MGDNHLYCVYIVQDKHRVAAFRGREADITISMDRLSPLFAAVQSNFDSKGRDARVIGAGYS